MPLILPGNVASATASTTYTVANSCRFDGSSSRLAKSSATGTSNTKGTISWWLKRGKLGVAERFINSNNVYGAPGYLQMYFETGDTLRIQVFGGAGSTTEFITDRKFRDPNAWYHMVFSYDSTPATPSSSSIRLFINGTQETSFSTETYASQNVVHYFHEGNFQVGSTTSGSYFSGYMAEVVMCDGQAYAASDFGEFDSDSPTIWKPKDVSGLTFGDNGFYLDFEDSANLGNDANGGTDFGETNLAAADQATDTPTNNFCIMSPVISSSYPILSGGNNIVTGISTNNGNTAASMAVQAGKWYAEVEFDAINGDYPGVGMWQLSHSAYGRCVNGGNNNEPGDDPAGFEYNPEGEVKVNTSWSAFGSAVSAGDIVQIALDCDNGAAYVGVEGVWQGSGDPTSGASKTGAAVTWTPADKPQGVAFGENCYNGSVTKWNFGGSPAFTVSSGNADANGYGNFEYAVPSGYYALCTKNLGEFGG